jgi:hypothetical protein
MSLQITWREKLKLKVSLFDWTLVKEYMAVLTVISVFFTLSYLFVSIPDSSKFVVFIILSCIFIVIYIVMWFRANWLEHVKININNSIVDIRVGNIFEEKALKVIAFNEYFDTLVNDVVISAGTLNGKYVTDMIKDIAEFDNLIENDEHLAEKIVEKNSGRKQGKHNKYKLGTIFKHNDYLLTAFSKFDQDNRAFLYMNDYVNFLLNFWNEVDIVYNGRSISIPLLGSGITRLKEYNSITDQEILELLIWSFKISRIKFSYPSKVSIIIDKSKKDKINFFKLNHLMKS